MRAREKPSPKLAFSMKFPFSIPEKVLKSKKFSPGKDGLGKPQLQSQRKKC
jgi:hypothetical protein